MSAFNTPSKLAPLFITLSLALSPATFATDFTILNGETETTTQTLNNNETGIIETGGTLITSVAAIDASGINNSLINSGEITTSGDGSFGVETTGVNATITNNGDINTVGANAFGIYSTGATATITNSGSIDTMGLNADGIYSTGANAIINNSGSITTANDGADGILSLGVDTIITNSGSITTTNESGHGIFSNGINAIITNSGSISTNGITARGIFSVGNDAIITNSGSISTIGDDAYGIYAADLGVTVTNSGSISTVGSGAYGIYAENDNNVIHNSGSILTSGDNSYGIVLGWGHGVDGENARITNSGSIIATGDGVVGIRSSGVNATIINSGSILTEEGDNGVAIYSTGEGATIINSGTIKGWWGIEADAANVTITNSGLISATDADGFAVSSESSTTLNLLPGSQIIGRINLGSRDGLDDTANVYSGGISANLTFENTENINLFGAGILSGNNIILVDATGESTRGVVLANMTSSIHSIIGQRMAQTTPLEPVQVAALTLSPGMYFEEHKPVAWAQVFGGTFDRDAEGIALAYDHNHVGINFGYEWDVNQNRVGLMGGIVVTDTKTQTASFSSDANNYYIGAYGNRKVNGINITASLLAGYGDHDNDRRVVDNLNGYETAKSDFGSFFISPSLTIASAYTIADRLELRPSANISYSTAWLDDYTETGTTNSNISVDDRKAKALTAKVQLAAAYALSQSSEFEFRVGMNSRHTDDEDTNVSIAGSQFKFANAGDENVSGGFAGASLRVVDDNNLTLVADIEFGGNSDEDYAAGNISLEYVF